MKEKHLQPFTPAALYARVSSDRQDVDLSVAAQLRALRVQALSGGLQAAGSRDPTARPPSPHDCRCNKTGGTTIEAGHWRRHPPMGSRNVPRLRPGRHRLHPLDARHAHNRRPGSQPPPPAEE